MLERPAIHAAFLSEISELHATKVLDWVANDSNRTETQSINIQPADIIFLAAVTVHFTNTEHIDL